MNDHIRKIQAHALAVHTSHRERMEEFEELLAVPGARVVALRKPWPIGRWGTVMGTWQKGPRTVARVDFDGWVMSVPLDALARRVGAPADCATAQIWHKAAFVKFSAGEFFE